jgi:uncharacterized protein YjbI with pentapeptide repeats
MQIRRFSELILLPFGMLAQSCLAADFWGANLTGAHLTNADLRGSNLFGGDLTGASVTQRHLDGACGSETKLPDGLGIRPRIAPTVRARGPEAHNEHGPSTGTSSEVLIKGLLMRYSQDSAGTDVSSDTPSQVER